MNKESLHYRPEYAIPWRKHLLRLLYAALLVPGLMLWVLVPPAVARFWFGRWVGMDKSGFQSYTLSYAIMAAIFIVIVFFDKDQTLEREKKKMRWTLPGFVFYLLPLSIVRVVRWFKPTARLFWERFLLLMATFANLSSWLGIVYLVRIWKPFSPYVLDKIAMADAILFVPLAFVVNRFLDSVKMARESPYMFESAVGRLVVITNPLLLLFVIADTLVDRLHYRRR